MSFMRGMKACLVLIGVTAFIMPVYASSYYIANDSSQYTTDYLQFDKTWAMQGCTASASGDIPAGKTGSFSFSPSGTCTWAGAGYKIYLGNNPSGTYLGYLSVSESFWGVWQLSMQLNDANGDKWEKDCTGNTCQFYGPYQ